MGSEGWMGRRDAREGVGALEDEWLQVTVGSSCLQGLRLELREGAEICFYLCSGSGGVVKGETAEQLGAREASAALLSSQRADKNKCHALPFPHATAHPEHTQACTHTLQNKTPRGQAGAASVSLQAHVPRSHWNVLWVISAASQ